MKQPAQPGLAIYVLPKQPKGHKPPDWESCNGNLTHNPPKGPLFNGINPVNQANRLHGRSNIRVGVSIHM